MTAHCAVHNNSWNFFKQLNGDFVPYYVILNQVESHFELKVLFSNNLLRLCEMLQYKMTGFKFIVICILLLVG